MGMTFDIVLTVDQSTEKLFQKLIGLNYDLKHVTLILIKESYNVADDYLGLLKPLFKDLLTLETSKQNPETMRWRAFQVGNAEYVIFLDHVDSIEKDLLCQIKDAMTKEDKQFILGEFRQLPAGVQSLYHPLALEIPWVSSKNFFVKRVAFNELFGEKRKFRFDTVELNWKTLKNGYIKRYFPQMVVSTKLSSVYSFEAEADFLIGSLYFGGLFGYSTQALNDILLMLLRLYIKKNTRKCMIRRITRIALELPGFMLWRLLNRRHLPFEKSLVQFGLRSLRMKGEGANQSAEVMPKVSIIVRTCGRPSVLRETLKSLENQTYHNLEVVVFEDGENLSEAMIEKEFPILDIKYSYSGNRIGRCLAGNRAMDMATGKYLNFLDDDDLFLPDHVEVLVNRLTETGQRVGYSFALQTPIITRSKNPYDYQVMAYDLAYSQRFNRLLLFYTNYLPIQCVMFEKDVYLENGGFDPQLEALEDWDLWMRYVRENDFAVIDRITSVYRVPFVKNEVGKRFEAHERMFDVVRKKQESYLSEVKSSVCANEIQDIMDNFMINNMLRRTFKRCCQRIFAKIVWGGRT